MNMKTFFMSEDINLILNGNSLFGDFYKQNGIYIPTPQEIKSIRGEMLDNLKKTYGSVEVIPEGELQRAMQGLAKEASYPLVSLDEIYLKNNPYVDETLNLSRIKIGGKTFLTTRRSDGIYLPYEKEIERVAKGLKEKFGDDRRRPHRSFSYR